MFIERLRAVVILLVAAGGLGCQSTPPPQAGEGVQMWSAGPVRWLMLPDEEKELRSLKDQREAQAFIEGFWRRRDPSPDDDTNPYRTTFLERTEAADRLYGEPGRAGSLTDRGRVLILLGPPSILRYRQVAVPVLDPNRLPRGVEARSRWMPQEVWVYLPADLPATFLALLAEEERDEEVTLVFTSGTSRSHLLEGERYCQLAVEAALLAGTLP